MFMAGKSNDEHHIRTMARPPFSLLAIASGQTSLPPHQYLVQLLNVAASIEHALMVQYLFAAYSLDADKGADDDERQTIGNWQSLILSIAKEEMGHLLTVQNVLCLLGEPIDLARAHDPWDSDFQPFFRLERMTGASLSRYIKAEQPQNDPAAWDLARYCSAVTNTAVGHSTAGKLLPVGKLYERIIELLSGPKISDTAFQEDRFHLQASWDEWGRGHADRRPAPYGDAAHAARPVSPNMTSLVNGFSSILRDEGFKNFLLAEWDHFKKEPDGANVLVRPVATRQQAIQALSLIAEQGEDAERNSGSHFLRFSLIACELKRAMLRPRPNPGWEPAHPVADDPCVGPVDPGKSGAEITSAYAKAWANLFNHRYRMLLVYFSHSFQLAGDGPHAALRGALIHKAFGEMYNLKAIAGILVQAPLNDNIDDPRHAGPPFQLPPTLSLPPDALDRWRQHRKLLQDALRLNKAASTVPKPNKNKKPKEFYEAQASYLRSLRRLDHESVKWTMQVIKGIVSR